MPTFKTEISRRTFVAGSLIGVVALAEVTPAQGQNRKQQMESTIRVGV